MPPLWFRHRGNERHRRSRSAHKRTTIRTGEPTTRIYSANAKETYKEARQRLEGRKSLPGARQAAGMEQRLKEDLEASLAPSSSPPPPPPFSRREKQD